MSGFDKVDDVFGDVGGVPIRFAENVRECHWCLEHSASACG